MEQIERLVDEGRLDAGSDLEAVRRRVEAMERKLLPATMTEVGL